MLCCDCGENSRKKFTKPKLEFNQKITKIVALQ